MTLLKVPGRMGMILTLYLISANVYNSVDAPSNRGFSYIEVWMLGTQFPILLSLFEYGFVLYLRMNADTENKKVHAMDPLQLKSCLDNKIRKLDTFTMVFSFIFFLIFVSIYWFLLY